MLLKIKKIHPDAVMPHFAHVNDAGMDLFVPQDVVLKPGERKSVPLGIACEIPDGFAGIIYDKSGVSHRHGLKTFGEIIDAGYRGEIHAGIINLSTVEYVFKKGHKIAQMLIQRVEHPELVEAGELTPAQRGEKGFGSTGK